MPTTVEAFAELKRRGLPHQLVLVGERRQPVGDERHVEAERDQGRSDHDRDDRRRNQSERHRPWAPGPEPEAAQEHPDPGEEATDHPVSIGSSRRQGGRIAHGRDVT